jgi:hypothetical protein
LLIRKIVELRETLQDYPLPDLPKVKDIQQQQLLVRDNAKTLEFNPPLTQEQQNQLDHSRGRELGFGLDRRW